MAETAYQLKKKLYQEALTLVQNNQAILPLCSDLRRVCMMQVGGIQENTFENTLCEHGLRERYYIPSDVELGQIDEYLQRVADAETVIVSIFDMQRLARRNFGISEGALQLLVGLRKQNKKIILVLFGSPYSLKLFGQEDAIVMAYEDDSDVQQAAAQAIAGVLPFKGKLPVTASEKFVYGLGIHI